MTEATGTVTDGKRSVLRDRSLRALVLAEIVSMTGSQMTWLALPWFVFVSTGSATQMTLVVLMEVLGIGLFTPVAGRLLSRLGARVTMLLCDGGRAPLVALVPALHWADLLSFPVLLVAVFGVGALSAPYFSAQRLIVPELLGEDEARVTEATAFTQASTRVTLLLGPLVAGVLIGSVGAATVLLVDALTYLVALAIVGGFLPRRPPRASDETGSMREGIRFLVREPLLRVWNVAFAIGDAGWTVFFVAIPVLVVARFGADARIAGVLLASFGIGALVGNAVAYRYGARRNGLKVIALAIMGQALPLWLLPLPAPAWALAAALALSGVANGIVNPSIHAIWTLRIPVEKRATVMPTMALAWSIAQPIGLLAAGPALDAFGARPVIAGFAAVQTLTMAVVATVSLRELARTDYAPLPVAGGESG